MADACEVAGSGNENVDKAQLEQKLDEALGQLKFHQALASSCDCQAQITQGISQCMFVAQ